MVPHRLQNLTVEGVEHGTWHLAEAQSALVSCSACNWKLLYEHEEVNLSWGTFA